jgi:CelD/BcsL family acetyltransferase involved in cellulose biosynthesis
MNVKKINLSEFKQLIPDINQLLNNSHQNNIFLTTEWLSSWWELWGQENQIYILIAQEQQQLLGFAPLMINNQTWLSFSSIRVVSFINSNQVAADHLDFVCRNGCEEKVSEAIFNYLKSNNTIWDVISLENIPYSSITLLSANKAFVNGYTHLEMTGQRCPYLSLKGSWADLLSTKSNKFRKKMRYRKKTFEVKLGGQYKQCKTRQQIQMALERLIELNPDRWLKQGKTSSFSNISFQTFHLKVAEKLLSKGWLDLSYLEVDGSIIAVIYNYIYANKIYYYNTAFDPEFAHFSVGRVLMEYSIEYAFKNNLDEFDFLRGEHNYKTDWCTSIRENKNLLIVNRSNKMNLWCFVQNKKKQLINWIKITFPESVQCKLKLSLQKLSRFKS